MPLSLELGIVFKFYKKEKHIILILTILPYLILLHHTV